MSDKDAVRKLIELVINDSYDREIDILRWLFRKLEELEAESDVQYIQNGRA